MVFTAAAADQMSRLYVRNIDRWDTVLIPGTEDADTPFFSPDGQSIGYQQGQQIKTVSLY